jgi:hypothetical protein
MFNLPARRRVSLTRLAYVLALPIGLYAHPVQASVLEVPARFLQSYLAMQAHHTASARPARPSAASLHRALLRYPRPDARLGFQDDR